MLGLVQRGGMMAHTTRVRDLQVQYGDVLLAAWPPRWILSHDLGSFLLTAEDGKLTWVEPMPRGIGLWLTRRFDGGADRRASTISSEFSAGESDCRFRRWATSRSPCPRRFPQMSGRPSWCTRGSSR